MGGALQSGGVVSGRVLVTGIRRANAQPALTVDTAYVIWSYGKKAWVAPGGVATTDDLRLAGYFSRSECDIVAPFGSNFNRHELRDVLTDLGPLTDDGTVLSLQRLGAV